MDITFVSPNLAKNIEWKVSDHYTYSDHQAVVFTIKPVKTKGSKRPRNIFQGWAKDKMDKEAFIQTFSQYDENDNAFTAEAVTEAIKTACDASMPKKRSRESRKENYWWNNNIATLRKICLQARRKYQRSRNRSSVIILRDTYQQTRRNLKNAIKQSKTDNLNQLCKEIDINPWGRAYIVAMAKLKGKKVNPNIVSRSDTKNSTYTISRRRTLHRCRV